MSTIDDYAFSSWSNLTEVYFLGDAPTIGSFLFQNGNPNVYCLPETTGWASFMQVTGLAALLWNPAVQTDDANFGVKANQFGFNITGTDGITVEVEAGASLTGPWAAIGTNRLSGLILLRSQPVGRPGRSQQPTPRRRADLPHTAALPAAQPALIVGHLRRARPLL